MSPRVTSAFPDDPALPTPALERAVAEILEPAGSFAGLEAFGHSVGELLPDGRDETVIAGKAEQIVDTVCLTPRHQILAAEAAVGAQQDPCSWPAGTDLPDKSLYLFPGTGGTVDVRRSQFGGEQMATAEDVERQIAVAVVIPMKKPPLLMPMDRIVGRIEVENNLFGGFGVRFHEHRWIQRFNGRRIVADLMISGRLGPTELQTVERAFARQWCAVPAM